MRPVKRDEELYSTQQVSLELFPLPVFGRHLEYSLNKWASTASPDSQNEAFAAKMHLMISLWPLNFKTFLAMACWSLLPSFMEITSLSTEIARHTEHVLTLHTDNATHGRTDGRHTRKHYASRRLLLVAEAKNIVWNDHTNTSGVNSQCALC